MRIGLIELGVALSLFGTSTERGARASGGGAFDGRGSGIDERRTRSTVTAGMLGRLFGLGGGRLRWDGDWDESSGSGDVRSGTTSTSISIGPASAGDTADLSSFSLSSLIEITRTEETDRTEPDPQGDRASYPAKAT